MKNNKVNYVIDTFKSLYDLHVPDDVLNYSREPGDHKGVVIIQSEMASAFFSKDVQPDASNIRFADWKETGVPFLFNGPGEQKEEIISMKDHQVIINYDIIAASFYLLSGWQEFKSGKTDPYGRFPYTSSIQKQLGITRKPIVNYYFDILKVALETFLGETIKMKGAQEKKISVALTHDIDIINRTRLEDAFSSIRQFKPINLLSSLANFLSPTLKSSYIHDILQIEGSLGIKSTFFFLPRKGVSEGIRCADYSITNKKIKRVMLHLKEEGWEVSIHGSPGAESDPLQLKEDIQNLNMSTKGNRFHFLKFNIKKTPGILEGSGLEYDSTLGFAEDIGFRNAFCHPFFLYDPVNDRKTGILEIPLNVMDTTLNNKNYLGIGVGGYEQIIELIDEIEKFSGVATILWHNNYFSPIKHRGYRDLYINIINYLKKKDAVFLNCSSLVSLYT